jgi:CGNR zinc finger
MKSYYATMAVIRYYGPGVERKWPDPPHVAFANLPLDDTSLKMFTQRYGPLYPPPKRSRAEEILISESNDPFGTAFALFRLFTPDLGRAKEMQELLRRAWRRERSAIVELEHDLMQKGLRPWFGVTEKVLGLKDAPSDALTLWADDIWTVVRIAFLMDCKSDRAKICANPDCPTPWFVESRKGQEFCSHKCAVLINVRRFRQRQAKTQVRRRVTR